MRSSSSKTHQRLVCEVSKRFKSPGGSSSPAHPLELHGLPHSLLSKADGRKGGTQVERSPQDLIVICYDLCQAAQLPVPVPMLTQAFTSPSLSSLMFHLHLFVFPALSSPTLCVYVYLFCHFLSFFCHTPAHHCHSFLPVALLSSWPPSLVLTFTLEN